MSLFRDSANWRRANAAAFRQSRPDSDQSRRDEILARRAALLLRHRAPRQGRVVRRILLRHVFDRQDGAADGDRRLSDEFGDRGLSLKPAAQGEGLSHGLSERASDLWARSGGPERIHHAAEPMVPWLHADRARPQRPAFAWLAARVHRPPVAHGSVPQLDRGSPFARHRSDHSARFRWPSVFTLSTLRSTTSRRASCRIFCGADS